MPIRHFVRLSRIMRVLMLSSITALMLTRLLPTPAFAVSVIYVVPDGAGSRTGSSWANARDLAPALAAAPVGSQLWVKSGTYTPTTTDRTATFILKNGVEVYGGFAGSESHRSQRNVATNVTILSGDLLRNDGFNFANNADNSYHVVTGSATNATALLDGVTIRAGNASGGSDSLESHGGGMITNSGSPSLTNVTFSGNFAAGYGGGMYNLNSTSKLTSVTFSRNLAKESGGGMYNLNSNPVLTDVTYFGNWMKSDGCNCGVVYNGGGGMYNMNSDPVLTNVNFTENSAYGGGGMLNTDSDPVLSGVTFTGNVAYVGGGGMVNVNSNSILKDVTFSDNSAHGGGGLTNISSNPMLTNVIFAGNSAENGAGGMSNTGSNPVLTNVIFSANSAGYGGGGIFNLSSNPVLTNTTFSGNFADNGGGIYNYENSNPKIYNTIIWGNSDGIYNQPNKNNNPDILYSDIQGMTPNRDAHIVNVDPLFVMPIAATTAPTVTGNLRLQANSPVIDIGNTSLVPAAVTTDRDGKMRVVGPAVDLGAYEWQLKLASAPPSLSFGNQAMDSTSLTHTVTLTNTGTAPLLFHSISLTGSHSADYRVQTACSSLAASATCRIGVTFTPTALGSRTGELTILTNASGSPHIVLLSGIGTARRTMLLFPLVLR